MPSTASYRSSLRATFCATPCFPAHARVERAVPASCSTMCSDGLVVFLTCVLCCTKRMHLGRWTLSEETSASALGPALWMMALYRGTVLISCAWTKVQTRPS